MSNAYRGKIRVRFSDTDANGHAFFGNYFVFADEILGEYWAELGWDPNDVANHEYLTFTVNANMDFLGESLPGDMLDIEVKTEKIGKTSVVIGFTIQNLNSGEPSGKGTFTYVFVRRETRKSCPIPPAFRNALLSRHPELH